MLSTAESPALARRARLSFLLLLVAGLLSTSVAHAQAPEGDWWAGRYNELTKTLEQRIRSPRAAATLIELSEVAPHLQSLANLAAVFHRVARDSRAHPEVRALARDLLIQVELARGRLPRVKAQVDYMDFMRDGWLIGGFDNDGGSGHTSVLGPEQGAIDLTAVWPGKERDVTWRKVEAGDYETAPAIASLLRPTRNSTFYFLSSLESASAQRALLFFGTSGATRLWVNGIQVFEDEADHPERFDQRSVRVSLQRGANTVLVKVSGRNESPGVTMRATGTNGRRLARTKWVAPAPDASLVGVAVPGPRESAASQSFAHRDLLQELSSLAAQRPRDGELQQDLAIVLAARRAFDTQDQKHRHVQAKAAQILDNSARAQTRLAAYIEDDHNERRAALEEALNIDPEWAPARTALGNYYLERGFVRRGTDELTQAVADRPGYVPAILGLANAFHAMGLDGRARRVESEAATTHSMSPDALLSGARADRAAGRVHDAIERYRVLVSLRYDHRPARVELASLLLDTGDVDGAALELSRALELAPANLGLGLRLARMLSMNERPSEASEIYDRLVARAPDADEVFEARGKHRLRLGETQAALKDFQAALAIKPQNPRLREVVRSLHPQENYAKPYLRDAVRLATDARTETAADVADDPDAVVLSQLDVVRVYANGLASRTHQEVTWLVSQRGVEQARNQGIRYAPGEEEVKIERARIIKRDGSVVESKSENDRRVTDSSGGMYFDHRRRTVSLPNLEVGDVVEFTWRKDDISATNMFADYFGDVTYLQGTDPKRDVDYVLVAPKSRTFFANSPQLEGIEHHVVEAGADRVWRWRVRNVPRVEPEPRMPAWVETAAYLHVSTFKEWDDVGRFWWGLIREQLHVTPSVAAAAKEAVAGIPASDVDGRVRAVYNYVVTKTRYVGLEFGIHGFKPYPVDRVLARGFGDCKDKASLMYAMLEHLGIESRLVLLRMNHLGALTEKPASLAVFNHAILYVPQLDLWLDGTAEFSGSGELPTSDQSAQVLVVEPDSGKPSQFLTTPVSGSAANVTTGVYDIALGADGSALFQGTSEVKGQSAAGWRQAYQSKTGRKEKFEQGWARSYPGARLVSLDISDPRAIEAPVKTTFELELPRIGRIDAGELLFSPFGEDVRYVRKYAPLSSRRFPVKLGVPWRNEFAYRVKLPEGGVVENAQAPQAGTSPFGSYALSVTPDSDGTVLVAGHVAFDVERVEPNQYQAFRQFLAQIDRAFGQRIAVALPVTQEAAR